MKWLLGSAVLLAIGMIVSGAVAGRTLAARDEAVREGVLARATHELERELRITSPEDAARVLQEFLANEPRVSAVELRNETEIIARAGTAYGSPLEFPLFLGPSWRGIAAARGVPPRQAPFRVRIWAARGVGDSSLLAGIVTWGSAIAAIALLGFATSAARGVAASQHAAQLDAERRRLEIVSAAGAGLAHRIRNPLATIKGTAQLLESSADESVRDRARRIVSGSVRIESLIDSLLQYARPVEAHREDVDLAAAARAITGSVQPGEDVHVLADPEHVTSAIEELVANARAAAPGEPEVVIARRGRQGILEVRDRGAGLQIDAEQAFEPYVTTRPGGTGLGLAIIRSLIRANGGEISLRDREGGGCIATIVLPVVGR